MEDLKYVDFYVTSDFQIATILLASGQEMQEPGYYNNKYNFVFSDRNKCLELKNRYISFGLSTRY